MNHDDVFPNAEEIPVVAEVPDNVTPDPPTSNVDGESEPLTIDSHAKNFIPCINNEGRIHAFENVVVAASLNTVEPPDKDHNTL